MQRKSPQTRNEGDTGLRFSFTNVLFVAILVGVTNLVGFTNHIDVNLP
jgi:hypothetical protein